MFGFKKKEEKNEKNLDMPSRVKENAEMSAAEEEKPGNTAMPNRVKENVELSAGEDKVQDNIEKPSRVGEDVELSAAEEEELNDGDDACDLSDQEEEDGELSAAEEQEADNIEKPSRLGEDGELSAAEAEGADNIEKPSRVGEDGELSAAEEQEADNIEKPSRLEDDVELSAAEEEEADDLDSAHEVSDQEEESEEDTLESESADTKEEAGEEAELYSIEGMGIGIDLGTTNSEVSYIVDGKLNNLKIKNDTIIPSALFFESNDKIYYGKPALKRGLENKKSAIRHFKRKLQDNNEMFQVEFANKDIQPQENATLDDILTNAGCTIGADGTVPVTGEAAAALFLKYLKEEAMKQIGNINKAVITVPANFNQAEIEKIKRAGEQAGFNDIKILKEPTAAAIAYSVDQAENDNKKILVYDFGGGTFDVSIIDVKVDSSGQKKLEVIETGGNPRLGGEDLTQELVHYIYDKLEEQFDLNMESLKESGLAPEEFIWNENEIYKEAEQRKAELSESDHTTLCFPILYVKKGEQRKFELPLTRVKFEDIIKDKIKETIDILDNILKSSSLKEEDIDIVALAGGSSLLPIIQNAVEKHFGKLPTLNRNAATVISEGAAIVAQNEWNKFEESVGGHVSYLENTNYDFGVGIKGKKFDCLIQSGEQLPAKAEKIYSLVEDNQENLRIPVFRRNKLSGQTERTYDKGIEFVDEILITNLPPMKQTEASVIVSFELTQEDILDVDVAIKDSSDKLVNSKDVRIEKSSRLER
ncbi:MAG: Hsp70 family protein [bacterium]